MTNYHKFDADHVLDACRQCGDWATHRSHATATAYEKAEAEANQRPANTTVYSCAHCGGSRIAQQVNFLIDPNNVPDAVDIGNGWWDDYFYCSDCQQDVSVDEKEE